MSLEPGCDKESECHGICFDCNYLLVFHKGDAGGRPVAEGAQVSLVDFRCGRPWALVPALGSILSRGGGSSFLCNGAIPFVFEALWTG